MMGSCSIFRVVGLSHLGHKYLTLIYKFFNIDSVVCQKSGIHLLCDCVCYMCLGS